MSGFLWFLVGIAVLAVGLVMVVYILVLNQKRRRLVRAHARIARFADGLLPWTGACPDCGSTDFFEGPHGGLSVNIECADSTCKARFNLLPVPGHPYYERIGPSH